MNNLIEQEHNGFEVDSYSEPMFDLDWFDEQPDMEALYSEYEASN